jgi:hypothetical protein
VDDPGIGGILRGACSELLSGVQRAGSPRLARPGYDSASARTCPEESFPELGLDGVQAAGLGRRDPMAAVGQEQSLFGRAVEASLMSVSSPRNGLGTVRAYAGPHA